MIYITEIVITDEETTVAKLTYEDDGVVNIKINDKPFDLESWRKFAAEVDAAIQRMGEVK